MDKKISLSKITKKFLDSPYRLGGKSFKDGFDCLSLVRKYKEEIGLENEKMFEDLDMDDGYVDRYLHGEWKEIYLRYLESLGKVTEPQYSRPGDILVITNNELVSAGINVGNGKAMIITKKGIKVWPFSVLEIKEAVRIK